MVKKKSRITTIIIFCLIAILGAGLIGVAVKLNNNVSTKSISPTVFSRGTLNSSTGAVDTTDQTLSIYSSYITVDGLNVSVKDDDEVSYKVFFYSSDKTFISASTSKTSDYAFADDTTSFSSTPAFVRILITPSDGSQITLGNYLFYAGKLDIVVNK